MSAQPQASPQPVAEPPSATVIPASLTLGTAWLIRDLYVGPIHRRGGIARALLHHVIDNARANGAHRVSLQTETENTQALTLYTAIGFQPVTGLQILNLPLRDPGATA